MDHAKNTKKLNSNHKSTTIYNMYKEKKLLRKTDFIQKNVNQFVLKSNLKTLLFFLI